MTDAATKSTFDPEFYADAATGLLGIPVDSAWMPAILANLRILKAAADLVGTFPLPDEAETAPIFTA